MMSLDELFNKDVQMFFLCPYAGSVDPADLTIL